MKEENFVILKNRFIKEIKNCCGFCKSCPQRKETLKDINGKSIKFIECSLDSLTPIILSKRGLK